MGVGQAEVNHRQAGATEIEIPEESGRSKHKSVPRQLADALNGCLSLQVDFDTIFCNVLESSVANRA